MYRLIAPAVVCAGLAAAAPAFAQSTITGINNLDDRIDDVRIQADRDLANSNDNQRFDRNNFQPGWSGAMALTYSGTSGNTDTDDLAIAGKLTYGAGPWQSTFGLGVEYGKDDDRRTKQNVFAFYEGNYYFDNRLYAFGLARYEQDDFSAYRKDGFVGFGPGYRVINEQNVSWRVQAGLGARYLQVNSPDRPSETEGAGIVSSRFFYKFNEQVFLTNDTDILKSDAGTLSTNDLAVNIRMSDALTTRVSYRTDYNSEPVAGRKKTDNRFGVSLVVGF